MNATFGVNNCPDCYQESTYIVLADGAKYLLTRDTLLGEPERHVTLSRCDDFDATDGCLNPDQLYACDDAYNVSPGQ